ncbi:MAG: hypothetical protein FJX61_08545 [Alphaproteobacteria bacterium]|nr:hypothetical protein [Alphaproteobacteria bacterium]
MVASNDDIRGLIYRSCLHLDAERFADYIALCADDFRYCITAYSPDLRKDMVWLDLNRTELATLLENVPNHVRLPGKLIRQASVYTIEPNGGATVATTTALIVTYTEPDGTSRVYAVGRYHDRIDVGGAAPLLKSRDVRLETRDLGPGSHVPM